MSNLNFRSRPLDNDRPLPIFFNDDIPELADACISNRSTLSIAEGVEKEEENEVHLQSALVSQNAFYTNSFVIPTPSIEKSEFTIDLSEFSFNDQYIVDNLSRIMIDTSNYDVDNDDHTFLKSIQDAIFDQKRINEDSFENMMEMMENTFNKTRDNEKVFELVKSGVISDVVYNYWKKRRERMHFEHLIIPTVRNTERTKQNDPHVAFRKRTERMLTRRNRKEEEVYYEAVLNIMHYMQTTSYLLDAMYDKECENAGLLRTTVEIFYKRVDHPRQSEQIIERYYNSRLPKENNVNIELPRMPKTDKGLRRSYFWSQAAMSQIERNDCENVTRLNPNRCLLDVRKGKYRPLKIRPFYGVCNREEVVRINRLCNIVNNKKSQDTREGNKYTNGEVITNGTVKSDILNLHNDETTEDNNL